MNFLSSSPETTGKIATLLAEEVRKTENRTGRAMIIGLSGNLGAGKTTFVRSFARSLGIRKRITSPTFLTLRRYALNSKNYKNFFHVDAYRIEKAKELSVLGFKEIIQNPANIVVIEWVNKIGRVLPKKIIRIEFRHGEKENERKIKIGVKK